MSFKLTVATIKRVARNHGWKVVCEPHYGYVGSIVFPSGKKTFFRTNTLEVNTAAAIRVAVDKDYTKFFLKKVGTKVARGIAFYSERYNSILRRKVTIDDGYTFAKRIGFPVIVKPNAGSLGAGVYKAHSREDFYRVSRQLLHRHRIVITEELVSGKDYRVTVYRGKVYAAYERHPLMVTGDGKQSISELMNGASREIMKKKRLLRMPNFAQNQRILYKLVQEGRFLDTVLPEGKTIELLDSANLSTGGTAVDCTDSIHQTYRDLALRAAAALNLNLAGVDFIAPDITKEAKNYVVIEVNGNPGIENFMLMGKVQRERGYHLYESMLLDLSKKNNYPL